MKHEKNIEEEEYTWFFNTESCRQVKGSEKKCGTGLGVPLQNGRIS